MNATICTAPAPGGACGQLGCLTLAASLLIGCHREPAPTTPVALPAIRVDTAEVVAAPVTNFEEIPGTIISRQKAGLEAKIAGRVQMLHVAAGQAVTRDQVLLTLEAPEIQARVEQARAAHTHAEREHLRTTNLFARQAATRTELDAAQARLDQSRAVWEEARVQLGELTLVAPFDGLVSRTLADVGDLAVPGKVLLELEQPGDKRFEVAVPERWIADIQPGASISVRFENREEIVTAKVAELEPTGDPASRSWRVELEFPPAGDYRSGGFGRLIMQRPGGSGLVIPGAAVIQRGQLEMVFVKAGDQARLRLVRTGRRLGDTVEILSGLEAGEMVILHPGSELRDGQPVIGP